MTVRTDPESIVVVVPLTPPKELLPNQRRKASHWAPQAEATAQMVQAGLGAALNARYDAIGLGGGLVFTVPVIVAYEVTWPFWQYGEKKKIPDTDSIPTACKGFLDSIVQANIIADDSPEFVSEVRAKGRRGAKGEDGCTRVTVTRA